MAGLDPATQPARVHARKKSHRMKEEIRRAVAYALLAREGDAETTIYSYDTEHRSKMSGSRDDFFDHEIGARVVRTGASLYHYGLWHHIDLNVAGTSFSGFDHGSKTHFEGVINGRAVQLYDHGENRYFNYHEGT